MKQLTKEQALKIYDSGIWQDMNDEEMVKLQLFQDRICVDWISFRTSLEKVLGREIFTHELCDAESIRKEYAGDKEPPTLEDIINLIPEEKRVIIFAD